MMALRTAATGMAAQQLNVEVISNNIANMNTVGYKKQRAEFEDLLYQDIEQAGAQSSDTGTIVPTGIQIGAGVKAGSVYRITGQGSPDPDRQPVRPGHQRPGLLPGAAALRRDRLHPRRQLFGQRHRARSSPPTAIWCSHRSPFPQAPPASPSRPPARCR